MKVSNKRPPSHLMNFGLKLIFIDSGIVNIYFLSSRPFSTPS